MRLLATLRAPRPATFALVAVATIVTLALGAATATLAADPTPSAGGGGVTPSCTERYPQEGPAGLDLRLGCIIGEVVGAYTAGMTQDATPASTYALVVVGVVTAGLVAIWFLGRLMGRAAGRRLAPVRPDEWWLCASCRSVNGAGVEHCYSCGADRPADPGQTMRTDDTPSTTQSFGSTRKRG